MKNDPRSQYTDSINFYGKTDPGALLKAFGSPLYVYNEKVLRERCRTLKGLSAHPGFAVNYSVKANANVFLLRILKEEGLVVDAMSPGELYMDKLAGFSPEEILYISNNNSEGEMANALSHGLLISVDSLSQLERFGRIARGGKVMVRLNPGIGAGHSSKVVTGGKKTKFGVPLDAMGEVFALTRRFSLTLAGINQHIGSLFMKADDYLDAAKVLLDQVDSLPDDIRGGLEVIDFGGGFGIPYHKYDGEAPLDMAALGKKFHSLICSWSEKSGYRGRFLVEPGRFVAAECGVLLGRVEAVKTNAGNHFAGTDIGFNVLMRPVLYDSFHDVEIYRPDGSGFDEKPLVQTITGNVCESGDILAKE
ncbi:MAG: diaminopimelate decarboxylase, partial [Desulfovibrio sp.]|nr:diaminopimelate decarboxylase [Desulfovibrio sp.]